MRNGYFFVLFFFVFVSCIPKVQSQSDLQLIKTVQLAISEPSGITVFDEFLYIVSDENGTIYKTTLYGKVLKKIKTNCTDLEGVTYNPIDESLVVVDEAKRKIIAFDLKGNQFAKNNIKGKQNYKNSGLEGVCFDTSKNKMYAINEKMPKQLLELNLKGEILDAHKLDFSKDVSGICYDEINDNLWVISDESKAIYTINKKGKLFKKYKTGIEKMEGIVIYKQKIYVVSDDLNKLYIFKKP